MSKKSNLHPRIEELVLGMNINRSSLGKYLKTLDPTTPLDDIVSLVRAKFDPEKDLSDGEENISRSIVIEVHEPKPLSKFYDPLTGKEV